MRFFILICFLMLSVRSFAENCYDRLSTGKDSAIHQINVSGEVDSDFLKDMSAFALKKLYSNLGCNEFKVEEILCGEAIKNISVTEVCFAKNTAGYFLMSRDYLDNLNIIFNRWD